MGSLRNITQTELTIDKKYFSKMAKKVVFSSDNYT